MKNTFCLFICNLVLNMYRPNSRRTRQLFCGLSGVVLTLGMLQSASSAIPKKRITVAEPSLKRQETEKVLQLPMDDRAEQLRKQGVRGYANLVKIMFDESATMDLRWKAVTAAGRVNGDDARPDLIKALGSPTWYMRNAALLAMKKIDPHATLVWARQFLSDKALVVRASAVDVIEQLGDTTSVDLLWQHLDAPENFAGEQSLYVRRRMAEALARLDVKSGREANFIRLLNDKDQTLHTPAMQALEQITKKNFGTSSASLEERREEWLRWWKNHSI